MPVKPGQSRKMTSDRYEHTAPNVTVNFRDMKSSKELLDSVMQHGCLWWFGHVKRMEDNNIVKKCRLIEVEGDRGKR